jgi:aryl-alcohol dehydrogenase-like predicted oxidoreductase
VDYRFLGTTGLKISPLILGGMTFGSDADEPASGRIMDCYADAGGNVLDTANNYGRSEEIIGRWLKARGHREQWIVCSKVRFPIGDKPNDVGLSRKHIFNAIENTLRNLQTDYLDLYQAHCWDHATPLDETLRAFDDLITAGKVRYIGASNFAGWHLVKAVDASERRGWARYVNLQSQYNLLCRSPEWEILPACRACGIGFTVWSPLAAGWLSGKYSRQKPPPANSRMASAAQTPEQWKQLLSAGVSATVPHPHRIESQQEFRRLVQQQETDCRWNIIEAVADVAKARGTSCSQVALAWLLAQPGVTAPALGVRSVEQLQDNLGCLEWTLSEAELKWLNEVSDPGLPYPHDFFAQYGLPWR